MIEMSGNGYPAPWLDHYRHPGGWEREFPVQSVPEFFAQSADRFADRPLVDFEGRRFTYAELHAEAKAFAAGLQGIGIVPGDRVGIFMPNVPAYVSAYFGAMMAGAIVVNFSPLYTAEELEAQVADSGIRLLVTLDAAALLPTALKVQRESALETLMVARLADQLPWVKGLALRLFRRAMLATIPDEPGIVEWNDVLFQTAGPAAVACDPLHDIALIQYTGGTTGIPKGAMLTHRNLVANALQLRVIDIHCDDRDVVLGVLPLFHVFAMTCILNRTVANGGMIAMLPRFEAGQVLATIRRVRPTAIFAVPTMLQAMLDHPDMARTSLACVRALVSGGAPLAGPLRDRFVAATRTSVLEGYGLTESSGAVTSQPLAGGDRPGTIGQPLPGTRVRLLDKESPARDALPGEAGELAVQGPQVMQGYWNRPDAAAEAFVELADGKWLRTGDIATFDADGFLRIVDRSKDMIAVGGFKVFPSQVEASLLANPAIAEAMVIGVPDEYLGEVPRAYAVLRPGASATADELRDWLNARLGKHERVDAVILRDGLPKTVVGKLDRKTIKAEMSSG